MADYLRLDGDRILATVDRLRQRVEQRFPDSGLSRVAHQLCGVASQARERSEMLSLTGKIAALYVQDLEDGVVLAAVHEVEDLTTGSVPQDLAEADGPLRPTAGPAGW